jgi:hypothetical protein
MSDRDRPQDSPDAAPARRVSVGLIAAPGSATELVDALMPKLADQMSAHLPDALWAFFEVRDRLVQPPAELSQLISAARRRLLAEGWELTICVTDLPLQSQRRPVIAHSSASHGVGVLSLPALGPVGVQRRAAEAIIRLVSALVGDTGAVSLDRDGGPSAREPRDVVRRRVAELGDRITPDRHGAVWVARVVTGNFRLLLGMLRANRPWRLALRLSRALVIALGAGVLALINNSVWRLGDSLGSMRLAVLGLASVLAVVLTIVIGAGLWERAPRASVREQVTLFNVVTVTTVVIGILTLYAALFVFIGSAVFVLVPDDVLSDEIHHGVGVLDRLRLTWLTTSLAAIGGALGAGLENDEAVREAAYTYQPDGELTGV